MLSFIVIGQNEGWRLEKCFLSIHRFIQEENIESYEIIYIDSKSDDNSILIAKQNKVDKIFLITGVCNAAIGRNIGANESLGDILFFLDGDMELIPGFYKDIVDNQHTLIYPFTSGIEMDILYDDRWNFIESQIRRTYIKDVDHYTTTTGGLFVISRELWFSIKGMDNCQKKSQDLDLGIRLSSKGFPLCRKGKLWVNHYTQYYAIRTESLQGVKYSARLARKHLFNLKAQVHLMASNYSYWILFFCIVLSFSLFSIIPIIIYLLVPIYRTYRIIGRTKVRLNPLYEFVKKIKKDMLFLYYFVFFRPSIPSIEYRKV